MYQSRVTVPFLLLLILLAPAGCREAEPPPVIRVAGEPVRIGNPDSGSPHKNIHHVSRPVLLVNSGRFISQPYSIVDGLELETAFGIGGGRFARAGAQAAAERSVPARPVTFSLSFQPLAEGDPRTLHRATLDAGPNRNQQWWHEQRIDLSPLAGTTGRFIFEIGEVPKADRPDRPKEKPVPVWAESLLRPQRPDREGRLIILVSADTCRADALGCYGQSRWTSPHLDAFSRHCLLFENAYGPSPWTLPSHASLLTATNPNVHLLETYSPAALSPQIETITEVLARNDFLTAAFVDMGFITPFKGLHRGFDLFDYRGQGIERMNRRVLPWILERPADDLFVFFHFYDIHFPYEEAIPGRTFDSSPSPPEVNTRLLNKNRADDRVVTHHLHDLYHNGVVYTDYHFGHFLDTLKASGRYKDSMIIFLSDHGEEFGEHGRLGHQMALYQESLAVPLLIKLPGYRLAESRSSLPASLVDLMPTILAQAGLPSPPGGEGIDLLGSAGSHPDQRFVFGETVLGDKMATLIGRGNKLILHPGSGAALFDLAANPGEAPPPVDASRAAGLDLMSRTLVADHLWRRPGLHIWLGGLEPGRPVEIEVHGRGLQAGTPMPYWAEPGSERGEQTKNRWRIKVTPQQPLCGLVLGIEGVPPDEVVVTAMAGGESGKSVPIPLILPSTDLDGVRSHRCRCGQNLPPPTGTDLDTLDGSSTPLGLIHYRPQGPQEVPVIEEDAEITERLRQLGYLEE